MKKLFATMVCALLGASGAAVAADLKVFSTTAWTEIWHDLKPKFEARGHRLELALQPSGAIAKRVAGGTARALASSGMGVAVLKGAPKPDISTPEAFSPETLALLKSRGFDVKPQP